MEPIEAWHFLASDRRMQHTGEVIVAGETYRVEEPLIMYRHEPHACRRAIDALESAPGPIACRVRLGGEYEEENGTFVARERTVLWMLDATEILHMLARLYALDVANLWDAPVSVLHYLKTGYPALRDIARVAVRPATGNASAIAARSAALHALRETWSGAADAAWSAAQAISYIRGDDAEDAVRDTQNARLEAMIWQAHWETFHV
jgi:hypothetical protein